MAVLRQAESGVVRAMAEKTSALEDENAALKARSLDANARIKRLMQILKAYDRARFGRGSEKLGGPAISADEEAQQSFVFEEIETGTRIRPGTERKSILMRRVTSSAQIWPHAAIRSGSTNLRGKRAGRGRQQTGARPCHSTIPSTT
ncbi:hypothetical protein IQ03_05132 [Gemmobacter caeni]|uniref:Uncharacterized protein n=1 Tax=Gemmobacter caeni TaxID=589035 RepID=A0A2T6A7F5_9RHOB|nr:hypothetical protein C8N34_13712 [Gemmobacter caeni]TWI89845.1 hypothetical protein IQ03_05132 [Gemmobacter caeni]